MKKTTPTPASKKAAAPAASAVKPARKTAAKAAARKAAAAPAATTTLDEPESRTPSPSAASAPVSAAPRKTAVRRRSAASQDAEMDFSPPLLPAPTPAPPKESEDPAVPRPRARKSTAKSAPVPPSAQPEFPSLQESLPASRSSRPEPAPVSPEDQTSVETAPAVTSRAPRKTPARKTTRSKQAEPADAGPSGESQSFGQESSRGQESSATSEADAGAESQSGDLRESPASGPWRSSHRQPYPPRQPRPYPPSDSPPPSQNPHPHAPGAEGTPPWPPRPDGYAPEGDNRRLTKWERWKLRKEKFKQQKQQRYLERTGRPPQPGAPGTPPEAESPERREAPERREFPERREPRPEGRYEPREPRPEARGEGRPWEPRPPRPEIPLGPPEPCEGLLEMTDKGFGFLRPRDRGFVPSPSDPFVSAELVRQHGLREAVWIEGMMQKGGRGPQVSELKKVNGLEPAAYRVLPLFEELTAINPNKRYILETEANRHTTRLIDFISPIGRGQRGLIVAPPRAGKTTFLQHIAEAVLHNYEDVKVIVLLVDERPEEVTEIARALPGAEIMASSNDQDPRNHIRMAHLAVERAKRLVEAGTHVFMLLDSITRLARGFNNAMRGGGGKAMSGGLDSRALEAPRRLFAAARNTREAGSLTIMATALVETNNKGDDLIFQEFKGTGNMELVLDRKISQSYVYPAVDIFKSGTRREELLLPAHQLEKVHLIRRGLSGHRPQEAVERLLQVMGKYPNNNQMLIDIKARGE